MSENKNNIELSKYAKLLDSEEWREKRELIIARDKNKCQKCFNNTYVNDAQLTAKFAICYVNSKGAFLESFDSSNENRLFRKVGNQGGSLKNKMMYFIHSDELGNIITVFNVLKNKLSANRFFEDLSQTLILDGTKPIFNVEKIFTKYFNAEKIQVQWISTKFLNVHHKFYQVGKKPWEYNDDSLITLCRPCHEKIHQDEVIYLHDENGNKIELIECDRCKGTGVLPQFHYVENGICFKCSGNRFTQKLL